MKVLLALALVLLAFIFSYGLSSIGLEWLFGVFFPYLAFFTFVVGVVWKVFRWASSPVPFRIPTVCGQQKSLSFLRHSKLESPFTTLQVIGRMALEILLFRSLFRNTKAFFTKDKRLVFGFAKWLWLFGLLFHWSFLIIVLRHLRLFLEPVPSFVDTLSALDGFFQIGVPVLYLTDLIIVIALTYLFLRRVVLPQVRYVSLLQDYFPLFLILGIALTGILMRYFFKTDVPTVKQLVASLLSFSFSAPEGLSPLFYSHLFLVSLLFAYFPFSKLVHMAGVFLSPTRNLANNNRYKRHINPWNPEVKVHTYEEYEEEFYDLLKDAGYPLEREKHG